MTDAALTCVNHPKRETTLRCNRCDRPICSQCAVRTPVGYRCRECVRGQQAVFETARNQDTAVALVVSGVGVGIAVGLLSYLGYFGFLVAPIAGGGIAEVVRWAVRRRRSRNLPLAAAIGGGLGVLPHLLLPAVGIGAALTGKGELAGLTGAALIALWPIAYGAFMVGTLYYRLRGIRL